MDCLQTTKPVLVVLGLLCAGVAQASAPYPVFSWDTVPVCLHFGSTTRMTDEQIQLAARMSNLICLEKAHGTQTDREHPERVAGEDARRIKQANPRACFLIGARENSFFCYGWGYNIADGQLIEYPEYGRRLGPPKEEAVRQPRTWVFRREFEHAKVTVDLERREGTIQWLGD